MFLKGRTNRTCFLKYLKGPHFSPLYVAELAVFREWLRYNFGVFTEAGFSGDNKYPQSYEIGNEVKENIACQDIVMDEAVPTTASSSSDFNGFPFQQMVSITFAHFSPPSSR